MKKNTIAIFDTDEEYATRLMDYLCETKELCLDVQAFTFKEKLMGFMRKTKVDILLLPEGLIDDDIESAGAGEIMALTEGGKADGSVAGRSIYRYQSSENILREVLSYYAEGEESFGSFSENGETELIGVYSPLHCCLKTKFALCMGEILAREHKALYVNLESYSGFNTLFGQNYLIDLSDLMFYVGQKKKNFPFKLASVVSKVGELDIIPPSISPADTRSMDLRTWNLLFDGIISCGYQKVIIDFGEAADGAYELLKPCSVIYMPVRDDPVSRAKLEQYEACLRIMEFGSLLEKTVKLSLPDFGDLGCEMQNLIDTGLGDYILEKVL